MSRQTPAPGKSYSPRDSAQSYLVDKPAASVHPAGEHAGVAALSWAESRLFWRTKIFLMWDLTTSGWISNRAEDSRKQALLFREYFSFHLLVDARLDYTFG